MQDRSAECRVVERVAQEATLTVIDCYVSRSHYLEHVAPVWHGLVRAGLAGELRVRPGVRDLLVRAGALGLTVCRDPLRRRAGPVLVASYGDARLVAPRPVVLMEHGAGQGYVGVSSYAGGADRTRDRVVLFLCPGPYSAERCRAAYPDVPVVAVGSPRVDALREVVRQTPFELNRTTLALAFHWDARGVCPEAGTAWPHYRDQLGKFLGLTCQVPGPDLASWSRSGSQTWQVLGHGHPRVLDRLAPVYRQAGIEVVRDFTEVVSRASLLVADNSSVLYEWAALGRPVVVLNAPWYRRDVEHGLRFWSHVPGPQVDGPEGLDAALRLALADPPEVRELRERAVAAAYGVVGGDAASRAVAAIRETLNTFDMTVWQANRRTAVPNPKAPRVRRSASDAGLIPEPFTPQVSGVPAPPPPVEPPTLLGVVGPPEPITEPETNTPPSADEVPQGSVRAVLAWVGTDADRARRAIETEKAGEQRASLIFRLGQIARANGGGE